jgi:hypothetical protein
MATAGAIALAPGANAGGFAPATYGKPPADVPGQPAAPGYYRDYAAGEPGAYDRGYAQGVRDGEDRDADRTFEGAAPDRNNTYAPASAAETGPNTADAPRASEASTSQNEACGTDPGENNHTLGLPKLVNLNMC